MQAPILLALGSGEFDEVDQAKIVVDEVSVDQF